MVDDCRSRASDWCDRLGFELMSTCADAIERRFGDGGPSGEGAAGNEFIRRVLARKTVRRYSDVIPSDGLLDLLVAVALSASAKSDFQQASILRVTDPSQRAAIGALFPGMPWIGVSPVFFVFLGDARRLQRIGELRGKPVRNGTLEGFFNASVDAALAMQTMILCAESVGLGGCPISVIRNEVDKVAAILEVARSGFSGRRALPRLSAGRGLRQSAPAAPRHDTPRSLRRPRPAGRDRRLRPPAGCFARHSTRAAAVQRGVWRGGVLRLVRRQGPTGRQGGRRGIPALSAFTRIQFRLRRSSPGISSNDITGHHPTEESLP